MPPSNVIITIRARKMKITPDITRFVEGLRITEDDKQDLYVKILEYEGPAPDKNEAWINTLYSNLLRDRHRQSFRRQELAKDRHQELEALMGDDDTCDPYEYLAYEETARRVSKLSDCLLQTIVAVDLEGKTPEEYAMELGVRPNVVYTRLSRARKQLEQ